MKIVCERAQLSETERKSIGGRLINADPGVTVGTEYLTVGLIFSFASPIFGSGSWVRILAHPEYPALGLAYAPLALFAITDGRISREWRVARRDSVLELSPPLLQEPYFDDRLTSADKALAAQVADLIKRLASES